MGPFFVVVKKRVRSVRRETLDIGMFHLMANTVSSCLPLVRQRNAFSCLLVFWSFFSTIEIYIYMLLHFFFILNVIRHTVPPLELPVEAVSPSEDSADESSSSSSPEDSTPGVPTDDTEI